MYFDYLNCVLIFFFIGGGGVKERMFFWCVYIFFFIELVSIFIFVWVFGLGYCGWVRIFIGYENSVGKVV